MTKGIVIMLAAFAVGMICIFIWVNTKDPE